MNEKEIHQNWKLFASKNGWEFTCKDTHHIHGITSKLQITNGNKLILEASIRKSSAGYLANWTKAFLDSKVFKGENLTIKNSFFARFTQS